jgi:hypothetical protein
MKKALWIIGLFFFVNVYVLAQDLIPPGQLVPRIIENSTSTILTPMQKPFSEKLYSVTEYIELQKERDQWKQQYDSILLIASQSELDKRMIVSSLFQLVLSDDVQKLKEAIRQIAIVVLFGSQQNKGLSNQK